jgi:AcrR family transcriptional regulator
MLAGMSRPRQARSVETRARLLAAAAAIIAEQGIEGASVDAIAERAERTSGSLYGQFGSKDGLLVELLDESLDLVAESVFADIEAATSLDERLAALWRNFTDPPAVARDWVQFEHEVWVWANRPGNADAAIRLGRRYRSQCATLAVALDEWADEGLTAPLASSLEAATMLVGTLLGLEMVHRQVPDAICEASVVAALRDVLRAHAADSERPTAGRGTAHTRRPAGRARATRPPVSAVPDPAPVGDT